MTINVTSNLYIAQNKKKKKISHITNGRNISIKYLRVDYASITLITRHVSSRYSYA